MLNLFSLKRENLHNTKGSRYRYNNRGLGIRTGGLCIHTGAESGLKQNINKGF